MKHAKQQLESVCDNELKACPKIELRLVQGDAGPGDPQGRQSREGGHGGPHQPWPRPR